MKNKVTKIKVATDGNELGTIWIERLIDKLIMDEMNLPIALRTVVLHKQYQNRGDINDDT